MVFRSATVRLDSLSRTLDTRRQLYTRVPCSSLSASHLDLPIVDVELCFPRQCGGAQRRARPKTLKRRRRRADHASQAGPSNHTGAQTTKKRKPGSRVTKNFGSDGKTLNEGTPGGSGTGFRKQAQRWWLGVRMLYCDLLSCTVTEQERSEP